MRIAFISWKLSLRFFLISQTYDWYISVRLSLLHLASSNSFTLFSFQTWTDQSHRLHCSQQPHQALHFHILWLSNSLYNLFFPRFYVCSVTALRQVLGLFTYACVGRVHRFSHRHTGPIRHPLFSWSASYLLMVIAVVCFPRTV